MDLEFIYPIKLLMLYGTIGFVFSSIACLIETLFKCIGPDVDLFCNIYSINNDINNEINIVNNRYIENAFIFFESFSSLNSKDKIIEILIIFVGMIFQFSSFYFDILVIYYLTPLHFMFSSLVYLFMMEITILIMNHFNIFKFNLLSIFAYIFSFIGFLIYLEIIELNFCKLNYNLRKYIRERSIEDINEEENNDSFIINDIENNGRDSIFNYNNKVELTINEKNKI